MGRQILLLTLLVLTVSYLEARPQTQYYKSLDKLWSDCTKPSDHGKIINVDITPNPPQRGKAISIVANLTLDEDVTGGKIEGTIQMGPFPYKQTFDLCDSLAMVGETCPLKKGSEIITYKDEIPATTPPGHYDGVAKVMDQTGNEIFCIKMDWTLN